MNKKRVRDIILGLTDYEKQKFILNVLAPDMSDLRPKPLHAGRVDIHPKTERTEASGKFKELFLQRRPLSPVPIVEYVVHGQAFAVWNDKLSSDVIQGWKDAFGVDNSIHRIPVECLAVAYCQTGHVRVLGTSVLRNDTIYGNVDRDVLKALVNLVVKTKR